MRIAFLVRAMESGGAERAASALAGAMAHAGHDVSLLVLLGHTSFYSIDEKVRLVYLQPENAIKFGTVQRIQKLRNFLKKNSPDVLVGMSPFMSAYAVICCVGLLTLPIGTERANPFVLYADYKTTVLRKAVSLLCKGFVCQTEKALTFFPSSVRRKAAVIPNAVFNPLALSVSVPNERKKTITALGRLDHNKGYDLLLHAFKTIHDAASDYRLTIYGEGKDREALQTLAAQLGIAPYISLPGNQQDALIQVAASSVFVLSSRSEGMPNALMEAMAAGVPCVATRCDMGPEELIADGVNGLLVPTENADAIAQAVLRILGDESLSASLSNAALQIRKTHAMDAIAKQWIEYFRILCE